MVRTPGLSLGWSATDLRVINLHFDVCACSSPRMRTVTTCWRLSSEPEVGQNGTNAAIGEELLSLKQLAGRDEIRDAILTCNQKLT